jgi:hypothetical protein
MAHPKIVPTLYADSAGRPRELVVRPGAHGSLLVLDRDPITLCDQRLVAHLAADEPAENATLICRMYLGERRSRTCRPLAPEDLLRAPLPSFQAQEPPGGSGRAVDRPLERDGFEYRILLQPGERGAASQLRWCARSSAGGAPWGALTLREVLAALEAYEPARSRTRQAIAQHGACAATLRRELTRLQQSALVLNRGLREALLGQLRHTGASMGEIALRCGMVKRDRRGTPVGDTTWLARRVGLMPEGGARKPARWVHSDTLALIARRGLGLSPHEVELG